MHQSDALTRNFTLLLMQYAKKKKRERGRGKRDRRNIPFNFSLFAYIFLILSFQRNQLVIIPGRLRYTLAYNAFRRNVLISHNTITLNFSNDPSSHKQKSLCAASTYNLRSIFLVVRASFFIHEKERVEKRRRRKRKTFGHDQFGRFIIRLFYNATPLKSSGQ